MTHEKLPCELPQSFEPLMVLLHSLMELALIAGIGLATLGIMVVGLLYIIGGPDNLKRAKRYAKAVIIGVLLLLSAHMIMDFLIGRLGEGVIC